MKLGLILIMLMSLGCTYFTSWSDVMGGWVGHDIDDITELYGKPDATWVREDGSTIYKYHHRGVDPSCVQYWVVNQAGTITGFYYEGWCRPI